MKILYSILLVIIVGCQSQDMKHVISKKADFQTNYEGKQTDLYFLKNKNRLEMAVTNFGARAVELWVPDKNGSLN